MYRVRLHIVAAFAAISVIATPVSAQQTPAAAPAAAKPEAAKPEAAKPEAAKPEEAKPEQAKPEAAPVEGEAEPAKPKPPAPPTPTPEDIEKAKQHYINGAGLLEQGKHAEAVTEFKQSFRLSRNPLLLFNIGFVYDELKDKSMALFYFQKFLADAPGDTDNHKHARTRVKLLERELEAEAAAAAAAATKQPDESAKPDEGAKPDKGAAAATDAADVEQFMHKIVEEAPPGKPLDLTAFIPRNANWQLTLAYRAQGDTKWTKSVMKVRYNEMVGRIPAEIMSGSTVQYFIEVKDRAGKLVARSGRSNSPNIVFIDADARAQYYPDFGDDGQQYTDVGGAGGDGANGATFGRPDGGYFDVGSDKFSQLKWGSTAVAGGLATTAMVSYFLAAGAGSDLEAEAYNSNRESTCDDFNRSPCTPFDAARKDKQRSGKRYQQVYRVTITLGLVSGGLAGYLWYKEISAKKKAKRDNAITVVPVLGPDLVGGAAAFEF